MGKYSQIVEAEVFVKGGFPAIARGRVCFPDRSVGLDDYWVEDTELLTLKKKPCTFMEKKMADADWRKVEDAILEAYEPECGEEY